MSAKSAPRLTRRFWFALPAAILLVAVGLALLVVTVAAVFAKSDFENGKYAAAENSYSVQRTMTQWWPQPWKAVFNEGTATLLRDDFFSARRTLEEALELVPPAPPAPDGPDGALDPNSAECMVRTNLSLAIEGLAIEARQAKSRVDSIALYNEALEMIGPCTSDGESESDEDNESESDQDNEPEDSHDESTDESTDQSTDDSSDQATDESTDSSDGGGTGDSEKSPQDRIEERQKGQRDETREEQQQEDQSDGEGSSGGQNGGEGTPGGGAGENSTDEPEIGEGGGQKDDPRIGELEDRNKEANEHGNEAGGGGFGGGQSW